MAVASKDGSASYDFEEHFNEVEYGYAFVCSDTVYVEETLHPPMPDTRLCSMKRLLLLKTLMPNAKVCDDDALLAADFMDGPTALRVAVRVDNVPDWFALVGMLKEYGGYVKRYQFDRAGPFPSVRTLCLDFEDGYRDRANKGHDSLFLAARDLRAGTRN